ncbi:glycosyl hydrolase family 43 [Colletotrichum scovillei]|nr:glycosyl hydrolase family 43 [Colletotrichum scovillei]
MKKNHSLFSSYTGPSCSKLSPSVLNQNVAFGHALDPATGGEMSALIRSHRSPPEILRRAINLVDPDISAQLTQRCYTCLVSVHHPRNIKAKRGLASGSDDALGEGVRGPVQALAYRCGVKCEAIGTQAPGVVVGVVIPLPAGVQSVTLELVDIGPNSLDCFRGCDRHRVLGTPTTVCICDHGRPTLGVKLDRGENGSTATGVHVNEGHVIPPTVLSRYKTTLMRRSCTLDGCLHLRNHLSNFIRTPGTRRRFQNVLFIARLGDPDVVISVDVVEPRALDVPVGIFSVHKLVRVSVCRKATTILPTYLIADLCEAIRGQLRKANVDGAVGDVHGVVGINQQAEVVVTFWNGVVMSPRPLWAGRSVDVRLIRALDAAIPVKDTVAFAISQGRSPDAVDVARTVTTIERELRTRKLRHRVRDKFPVDEVVGSKQWCAGRIVHCRSTVVVRVSDSEDFIVGEVGPYHRIGKGGFLAGDQCLADLAEAKKGEGEDSRHTERHSD